MINQIDPISVLFTLPTTPCRRPSRPSTARSRCPCGLRATATRLLGTGTLTLLNNQIDTATGTVQLKAQIPNPQHHLWPGQFVNIRLVLGERAKALTVPEAACSAASPALHLPR